jgi:hypothetical protein
MLISNMNERVNINNFNDVLFCEIQQTGNTPILIGVVYRSPNSTEENNTKLLKVMQEFGNRQVLIMGDFNFPSINWKLELAGCKRDSEFLEAVKNNYLIQHVDFPTRGNNILDLVLTNEVNMVESIESIGRLGSSDHDIIKFDLFTKISMKRNDRLIPNLKKANFVKIKEVLHNIDWVNEFEHQGVEEAWNKFKEILKDISDKYVPLRKVRNKNTPLWMKNNIMKIIRKKRKLWKVYRETKEAKDYFNYKAEEAKVKRDVWQAKKSFEKELACKIKTNPKAFYSYVRSKQKTKDVVGPLKGEDGVIRTEDKEIANTLNSYFSSVFTKENSSNPELLDSVTDSQIGNVTITEEIVKNKIRNMKSGKAPGVDNIYPDLLRETIDEIAMPLTLIFKKTIELGTVPNDWKIANITPIYKKGPRLLANNYRPVSLTSVICKIQESIIKDEIIKHLENNDLIKKSQHGFTKGRSCLTNLLEFIEDITKIVDRGEGLDIIYLDFQKAFDKVPHNRLLSKLKAHGITGKIYNWIQGWLKDRKQRVVINGEFSDWIDVISGVPQGSVLGPLLFLIYINDLDENVSVSIKKFADDTKIYSGVGKGNVGNHLQDSLNNLSNWASKWDMKFNVDKCKVLHVGKNNPCKSYTMNGKELISIDSEKDLGIHIDKSLKPTKQCAEAAKKGNRALGMIKRNFAHRSKDVVLKLYKQIVRPHLEYAVQAWSPYYSKDIKVLEDVQKRATKLVYDFKDLSYEARLKKMGLTSLKLRRIRGDMIEVYKILTGREKVDKNYFFTASNNTRVRGHKYKLYKQRCRIDIRKNTFANRVIDEWNRLPTWVVESDSINGFKNNIDKFYKNRIL